MNTRSLLHVDDVLTPDIDFCRVYQLTALSRSNSDVVFDWPERKQTMELREPFTSLLGSGMEQILSTAANGQHWVKAISKPSHSLLLSLITPLIVSQTHTVWTSSHKPIITRRADQKHLDYDFDTLTGGLNLVTPKNNLRKLSGPFFLLSDRWTSHNLYHWTYDSLARIPIYIELKKQIPGLQLLLIGQHNLSFHREWLDLLGITGEIYTVDHTCDYVIDNLFYMPRIGLNSPVNVGFHLSKLLAAAQLELPLDLIGRKKIFINRRSGNIRSLVNSELVSACLRANGYIELFLEDFSIMQKLVLAQSCAKLVGISGSGMFFLSFMRPGSCILEITHNKIDCPAHYIHSISMNHHYGYVQGNCLPGEIIDLNLLHLQRALDLMP